MITKWFSVAFTVKQFEKGRLEREMRKKSVVVRVCVSVRNT